LEETVQSPGGTDWRSPFRFAARAENPPDVIYLMTDGQTASYEKMEEGIGEALKAANTPRAIVNVVSFNSEIYDAKHRLKDLARKYSGQYIEIK
jgi:Mg-chelatase subunit ChlD